MKYTRKINTFILDTLFPISCLFCKKGGDWLCLDCAKKITLLPSQVCPYCETNITPAGNICQKCKIKYQRSDSTYPLDGVISATEYQSVSKLVHLFKYKFILDLGLPLGKIMTEIVLKNNLALPDLIIPIPIHKKKLKWRGFNQAEILAQIISQNLASKNKIDVRTDLIYRQKYTQAQMKINNYQERLTNIKNAFILSQKKQKLIAGKKIFLIDDIATTGATLFECAKILKSAGAKTVCGIVIARQKIQN